MSRGTYPTVAARDQQGVYEWSCAAIALELWPQRDPQEMVRRAESVGLMEARKAHRGLLCGSRHQISLLDATTSCARNRWWRPKYYGPVGRCCGVHRFMCFGCRGR